MTNQDNEFQSFKAETAEEFLASLPKKIWKNIDDLTTVTNVINHDYVDTEKTGEYIHIDFLINNLITHNQILFPHQNATEWEELIYEFKKLLGSIIAEEDQFHLGIHPDEIKFIRSYLKENITQDTPFQSWECSYQFEQSLYNAFTNVWEIIIKAITDYQTKDIDLNKLTSLDKLATRTDFREIIKKKPLLYFYINNTLKVSKKKTKLYPNCKLTFTDQEDSFYKISPEDLLISNEYSINYTDKTIQISSIFLQNIALRDISNRQLIVPTNENIEYLQENLKDIQSYLTLSIDHFNTTLHLNQVYIQNESLIELGINQPTTITKTEQRNTLLTQLIKDNLDLVQIDGITCTITKDELWGKCAEIDKKLFASGKDDFFNTSKNPKISEIIKFASGAPKKN